MSIEYERCFQETLVDKSVIKNSRRAVYVNSPESTVSTITSLITINDRICTLSFLIVMYDLISCKTLDIWEIYVVNLYTSYTKKNILNVFIGFV